MGDDKPYPKAGVKLAWKRGGRDGSRLIGTSPSSISLESGWWHSGHRDRAHRGVGFDQKRRGCWQVGECLTAHRQCCTNRTQLIQETRLVSATQSRTGTRMIDKKTTNL